MSAIRDNTNDTSDSRCQRKSALPRAPCSGVRAFQKRFPRDAVVRVPFDLIAIISMPIFSRLDRRILADWCDTPLDATPGLSLRRYFNNVHVRRIIRALAIDILQAVLSVRRCPRPLPLLVITGEESRDMNRE